MNNLRSAVWFVTMACNFKCHYCWEVQAQEHGDFKPEKFQKWEDWAAAWNRLKPTILDITGGEPMLQPGFLEMVNALAPEIRLAITTNLSYDMTKFVQQISPDKVFSITASFHPTENRISESLFFGRCLMLKNRGFKITVNYVGWPEQLWLAQLFKDKIESWGLRFHFDPYSSIAYYPFEFNEAEKAEIERLTGPDRKPGYAGSKDYAVDCSGGIDHLSVQPDGSAWRCILDRQLNINPLGSILDPDFKLFEEPRICFENWRCPGCDKDKVAVRPVPMTDAQVQEQRGQILSLPVIDA